MRNRLLTLALLLLLSSVSWAAYTASDLSSDCRSAITWIEDGNKVDEHIIEAGICIAFVRGVMEEMEGELFYSFDGLKLMRGTWDDSAMPEQLIRVFVKYTKNNPETLNRPAVVIIRKAAESIGLFTYVEEAGKMKVRAQ